MASSLIKLNHKKSRQNETKNFINYNNYFLYCRSWHLFIRGCFKRTIFPTGDNHFAAKNASQPEQSAENLAVVVNNLEIPWEVAFLPAGQMLLIERPGNLYLRESGNKGE